MAETIMKLVLGKLSDELVQEAFFLYGVRDKVEQVQRNLKWIQSFLKDADKKRHKNERVKNWVSEVQEVGYLIEDVIEKFLAEVSGGRQEGVRNILKRIGKKPMKLIVKHKLGSEIDKIHKRLCEIKENKEIFGVEGLEETSTEQPIRPSVHPDIGELEVVGFEDDRKTIADQLIDTNIRRRSVISIVGAGGTGKSTLAKEVYKSADVKRHFGISMWLTISQEFNLIDILMKMLEKTRKLLDSERQNKGEDYFIIELNKSLRESKYLVVFDDVWPSNNVWIKLQDALPDANNGSRVLITTRFNEISEMADKISEPHQIQPLNDEDSKQLLLKKIFPNRFANECPNDLLPLTIQFTKKCGGWPLPLVLLGGILSRKEPDYIKWDEVMQNMDWQNMGSSVISTSYEDLPAILKTCFMYFGVFPEDYKIKAKDLIQLWIAEGFITQDGTKLLEDIAESYLEELVQRCMVQVSSRSSISKIKYCHTHDLLRDLAIQKAKEANFLTVITKNDTKLSYSACARRVALHGIGDEMIAHACTKKIRSLINFEDVPNFNRFGMLRVLHMSEVPIEFLYGPNCLKGLNALTALKYFGLNDHMNPVISKCNFPTVRFFKRSPLTYMKNLQTVSTWFCKSHGELPLSFWGNKQLRHINLECCWNCNPTLEGPPSGADLQSLQTLRGVRARQDWVSQLPNIPNIRKLEIVIPKDVAHEPLINLLSNLNHLSSLNLEMSWDNPITFPDCISAFKNHNRLHSFTLGYGKWPKKEVGDCTMFPPHLVKLILRGIEFEDDPMPQLEKLPNLRVLNLCYSSMKSADGKQMICSRGGFGRLHLLVLIVGDLEEWKIEEGAIPILNQLQLSGWKLQIVPDLQYLVNLQELTVDASDEVNSRLEGEDQWKIKHIPSVKIS